MVGSVAGVYGGEFSIGFWRVEDIFFRKILFWREREKRFQADESDEKDVGDPATPCPRTPLSESSDPASLSSKVGRSRTLQNSPFEHLDTKVP